MKSNAYISYLFFSFPAVVLYLYIPLDNEIYKDVCAGTHTCTHKHNAWMWTKMWQFIVGTPPVAAVAHIRSFIQSKTYFFLYSCFHCLIYKEKELNLSKSVIKK